MKLKSIALILMTVALPAMAEKVSVNTKGMSLILDVENGKPAQYLYFGLFRKEVSKAPHPSMKIGIFSNATFLSFVNVCIG